MSYDNILDEPATVFGGKSGKDDRTSYGKSYKEPSNSTVDGQDVDSKANKGPEIVYDVVKPKANKATKKNSVSNSTEIAVSSAKPKHGSQLVIDLANNTSGGYAKAGKISKYSKKQLGGVNSTMANDDLSFPLQKVSKSLKKPGNFTRPKEIKKPKSGKDASVEIDADISDDNETSVPTGTNVTLQIIGTSGDTSDSAPVSKKPSSQGAQFIGSHGQTSGAKSAKPIQTIAPVPTPSISSSPSSLDQPKQTKAAKRGKEQLATLVSSAPSSDPDKSNWAKGVAFSGYHIKTKDAETTSFRTSSAAASSVQHYGIPLFIIAMLGILVLSN